MISLDDWEIQEISLGDEEIWLFSCFVMLMVYIKLNLLY